jgi:hypothetical protein
VTLVHQMHGSGLRKSGGFRALEMDQRNAQRVSVRLSAADSRRRAARQAGVT